MHIQFATSEPKEAGRRVREAFPETSDALVAYVERLVVDGFVRVGDPMMYGGTAPIYPTPTCSKEKASEIAKAFSNLAESTEGSLD